MRALLEAAFDRSGEQLEQAVERSIAWSGSADVGKHFPIGSPPVTAEDMRAGLLQIQRILDESEDAEEFADEVLRHFNLFRAAGMSGRGDVLFTAYFAPAYEASYQPNEEYRWPLYGDPPSVIDVTTVTRREIDDAGLLDGHEIAWLRNELDAYLVHINGSAQLMMDDGSIMCVGHVRTNEHEYSSIGKLLIERGYASADEMSMQKIRQIHEDDGELVSELIRCNDRFVFFEQIDPSNFPRSALGIPLTPEASIATDRGCFPAGALVLVSTSVHSKQGNEEPFIRLMFDQDTGGAIQGAGRADLYLGIGAEPGSRAGLQRAMGSLYYILPKGVGP